MRLIYLFILFLLLPSVFADLQSVDRKLNITSTNDSIAIFDNATTYLILNRSANYSDNTTFFTISTAFNDTCSAQPLLKCPTLNCVNTPPACNPTLNCPTPDQSPLINSLKEITTTCTEAIKAASNNAPVVQQPIVQSQLQQPQQESFFSKYFALIVLGAIILVIIFWRKIADIIFPGRREEEAKQSTGFDAAVEEAAARIRAERSSPPIVSNPMLAGYPPTPSMVLGNPPMEFEQTVRDRQVDGYAKQVEALRRQNKRSEDKLTEREAEIEELKDKLESEREEAKKTTAELRHKQETYKDEFEKFKKEIRGEHPKPPPPKFPPPSKELPPVDDGLFDETELGSDGKD